MKFSDLDARQRVTALVDRDSFDPAFPDSSQTRFVLGTAAVAGRPVLVAFSDGHVLGGTFGVLEAERISTLLDRAADAAAPPVVILGFDTGGVRVEEGPRALAATSAAGIALAQLSVRGVRALSLISGPRGCFGAPSVMASLPERVVMTEGSFWGLTGPKLIDSVRDSAADASMAAAAAANRLHNGDCDAVVPDSAGALRSQLEDFVAAPAVTPVEPREIIGRSAAVTAELWQRLRSSNSYASPQPRWSRRRGLLEYTLRGQWHADGPIRRAGMLQAGFGLLAGHPTLSLVLGPAAGAGDGLGIEEAALLAQLLAEVVARPGPPALILSFLFCQGHAVDSAQERFGIHRALAESLRAMVIAKRCSHPVVTVLGGGTYGAAYFALAAPSHRILAMQGTAVAPMSPEVLRAFQQLRGRDPEYQADAHLAERIPEVRIVESVIRLPRILRDELKALLSRSSL